MRGLDLLQQSFGFSELLGPAYLRQLKRRFHRCGVDIASLRVAMPTIEKAWRRLNRTERRRTNEWGLGTTNKISLEDPAAEFPRQRQPMLKRDKR
jgi:hypothetical protein